MRLSLLLDCLPRELACLSSAYEAEAGPHPCLAPYPTIGMLLEGLRRPRLPSNGRRQGLIASIIRVHQTQPHRVWSTLLLHVFAPMIKKLRKVLVGGDRETRDGILAEAFQEVLGLVATDDPPRIFMYVRQELRREVFKALAEITAWEEVGFGTEADLEPDPSTVYEPPLIGVWLEGYGTLPEQAELLATLVDRGGLKALVHRRHGDLDQAGQARAFRCLQKKRQRLISALRGQLAAEVASEARDREPIRGKGACGRSAGVPFSKDSSS